MTFLFVDHDHHLNPTLPMKEYIHPHPPIPTVAAAEAAAQPKPASGEWTPEYVDCRLLHQAQVPWKTVCAVADAHNAALANANDMWDRASRQADTLAEYLVDAKAELAVAQEQLVAERELRKRWEQQCEQLHTQLAAEKEQREQAEAHFAAMLEVEKKLRKQLAAERNATNKALSLMAEAQIETEGLRKQPAAERERGKQQLIDELKAYMEKENESNNEPE